ncbi:hypothetical protein RclHR1_01330008 [Rhizophagus clarus]|uniref:P-loop containing nucleoside triphosphate hydrolase protein n=1 Tax=Rhizophagus clarus TaxID=94130 RepID=A0A2Z6QPM0_9GLOM|nr:hypothetical protein RclHR1_01330008 [Rhizophagus clarus]GES79889.1 P-loop containing nucleoside triphosphate hydrolase protein [Rhizophagus clarus]
MAPEFDNFPADKLKLWKKEIPDERDDLISNLSLHEEPELLVTKNILKYFPDSPPEEHIHVLVEPPMSTATLSREQKLLEEVASLKEKLHMVHSFPPLDHSQEQNFRL